MLGPRITPRCACVKWVRVRLGVRVRDRVMVRDRVIVRFEVGRVVVQTPATPA